MVVGALCFTAGQRCQRVVGERLLNIHVLLAYGAFVFINRHVSISVVPSFERVTGNSALSQPAYSAR
jgi:hypothetical protein